MGRVKLKIEQIKDSRKRATCFRKRAQGIMKKVEELSILCNCQLSLVIISENKSVLSFSTGEIDSILNEARQIHSLNEMYNNHSPIVASECPPEQFTATYMPQFYDGLNMIGSKKLGNQNEIMHKAIPAIPINEVEYVQHRPHQADRLRPSAITMRYPFP